MLVARYRLLALLFSLLPDPAIAQTVTAETILVKMAERYRDARSYSDTGVVLIHWPHKETPDEVKFSTFFARSGGFKFEWHTHHPYPPLRHLTTYSVIWSHESGVYLYRKHSDETAKIERERNLEMAIAGATGVSSGSARTIPALLFPLGGLQLTQLQKPSLAGQTEFEGVPCYKIRGSSPRGDIYELTIGIEDLLLRRIEEPHSEPKSEEIRRNIKINHDIPESVFHYEPPK